MRRKAQGLSINVIIIAAIALIILVVLIAIFTGRIGGFSKGIDDATKTTCDAQNGRCLPTCDTASQVRALGATCEDRSEICCIAKG